MRSTSAPELAFGSREPLLREGELLDGRYRVEGCLGGGGMASVYRARHEGLDQPVAIKIVSGVLREVPGVVPRFLREARAATRLKGEHVVRVFDVGRAANGSPYLAMELLEGKDLADHLDDGFKPTVDEAIDYTLQACEALAEVHGIGIVHRDLKPANLFVTRGPDGRACLKLIDFGISRFDAPLSTQDAVTLTNPDIVMGSPRYMPPEQMESATAVSSRSDIWGLGAILYEMLVGHAPFEGESLFDIYAAAVREPPAKPSQLRDDVPPELDEVILRCLRVDPNDRYADVAELAAALAPLGDDFASVRADAIARVLANARGRTNGEERTHDGPPRRDTDPSSRIRRRTPTPVRAARKKTRLLTAAVAVVALGGLGFIAWPMARQASFVPTVSVSGAAAATPAEVAGGMAPRPLELSSGRLAPPASAAASAQEPAPLEPPTAAASALPAAKPPKAEPPRAVAAPAAPAPPLPKRIASDDEPRGDGLRETTPAPVPKPSDTTKPDERLFEDRK